MKNKLQSLTQKKLLMNFLYFVIIAIGVIIITSSGIYYFYLNNVLKNFYVDYISIYQRESLVNMERLTTQIPKITLQILDNENVNKILFYNETNTSIVYKSINFINTHKFYNGIKSITIYNEKKNLIYEDTQLSPTPFAAYLSKNTSFENLINKYKKGENFISVDNTLFYVFPDFRGFYLVYGFDKKESMNGVLLNNSYINCDTAIYYKKGNLLFTSNLENSGLFDKISNELLKDKKNSNFKLNDNLIIHKEYGDFYAVSAVSYKTINAQNNKTTLLIVFVALFLLVIGFLFVLYYYKYFNNSISSFLDTTMLLKQPPTKNKRLLSAIANTFSGTTVTEDEKEILKKSFINKYHRCLIAQLDDYDGLLYENASRDISLLLNSIGNISKNIFETIGISEALKLSADSIGIVLSYNEKMTNIQILDYINKISEKTKENLDLSLTFTISNETQDIDDLISKSSKINLLKSYRFLSGYGSSIFEDMNYDIQPEELEYPTYIEKLIITAIDTQNSESYIQLLNNFMLVVNMCNYAVAKAWILQLTTNLIKHSVVLQNITNINFDIIVALSKNDTLEKSIEILENLFPNSPLKDEKEIVDKLFIKQVEEIVSAEYSNPDFFIAYLSEKLNISTSYTGQKFKKVFHKTFNAYLSEYRIEIAMELLKNTNDKIVNISQACGFSSVAYFIKIFKKLTMITPHEFRENYKNKSL